MDANAVSRNANSSEEYDGSIYASNIIEGDNY